MRITGGGPKYSLTALPLSPQRHFKKVADDETDDGLTTTARSLCRAKEKRREEKRITTELHSAGHSARLLQPGELTNGAHV
jgi:hypothetical protein